MGNSSETFEKEKEASHNYDTVKGRGTERDDILCGEQYIGGEGGDVHKIKQHDNILYGEQYIGEEGGEITLKAADVSLHIPKGALKKETLISIEIKSEPTNSRNGFNRDDVLTPTVTCKPDGQYFHEPVELVLPHCAHFDDITGHKVLIHGGNISVEKGAGNNSDATCSLRERYCTIRTKHFSDFEVSINSTKKRIGVLPFTSELTTGSSERGKSYDIRVWCIKDLPSEYILFKDLEKNHQFVPFDIHGKFILDKQQYTMKIDTDLAGGDEKVPQKKFNIKEMLNTRIEDKVMTAENIIVTVSRDGRKVPVCRLIKTDQETSRDISPSIEKVAGWCERLSELLLTWNIENMPTGPIFDEATVCLLENISSDVETNRFKKNTGVIGGTVVGIAAGIMGIVGAALIPVTAGVSVGLLAGSIAVGIASTGVTLGFSLDKTVRDKIRKKKTEECLKKFVDFQTNFVTSVVNIFAAREGIETLKSLQGKELYFVNEDTCDKLIRLIAEHEAGHTIDVMNMPDILEKIVTESQHLVKCLKQIGEVTNKNLVEIEDVSLETLKRYENAIVKFKHTDSEERTFVDFLKKYLDLEKTPVPETVLPSAAAAKEGGNIATKAATIAARIAVDVVDDVAAAGGNAAKIAKGFSAATDALSVVGIAVDAGLMAHAIYDLVETVKQNREQFSQGLLDVASLMRMINKLSRAEKTFSQDFGDTERAFPTEITNM